MTDSLTERRLTLLEKNSSHVHEALLSIDTHLTILERTMEKGFDSVEKRFDTLQHWLEERLWLRPTQPGAP